MYAYQQQKQKSYLHAVPVKHKIRAVPIKVKKVNPLISFFRKSVIIALLCSFAYYVLPFSYHRLIKQVFFPTVIPVATTPLPTLADKIPHKYRSVDLYSMANPISNYLSNDLYKNRKLLTPVYKKQLNEVTSMYQTNEMTSLKNNLCSLMKSYPSVKPAIYVWEYDKGQYVDINSEKMYSAASIIKIPVLIRLFKSIEAKQATIYDEMVLTDYYKSSGSGNLQYAQSGTKYTLDALAKTMIQDSDNTSTNMIMAKIGGMEDINMGLRDWGISKTFVRTWLPDLNGTNKTTAQDIAKLLYNLDNPGFLNINSREYITDYLSHVKNNRLIAAGLGEGALFIHKTGDIGTMLGDAGIVYAPNGKKYIVVILAERPYNSPQGKDFIVKASNLIYKSIVG